jgi:RNA polymerase sigma-70 factor (ECF subfamily)
MAAGAALLLCDGGTLFGVQSRTDGDGRRSGNRSAHWGVESFAFSARMTDDLTEARFIERLRARDERAFNELVRTYQHRVFGLLVRLLGRREEAEDIAQEVFVQVFKAIDSFRGESRLSTWIFRIAINLSKNRAKYLSRRHTDQQTELDSTADVPLRAARGSTFEPIARPDDLLSGMELQAIVEHAIAALEPDFREVLILRDIEDMSYEDIAQITGLADGTVKSRIHRARGQLKQAVELALGEKIE